MDQRASCLLGRPDSDCAEAALISTAPINLAAINSSRSASPLQLGAAATGAAAAEQEEQASYCGVWRQQQRGRGAPELPFATSE